VVVAKARATEVQAAGPGDSALLRTENITLVRAAKPVTRRNPTLKDPKPKARATSR